MATAGDLLKRYGGAYLLTSTSLALVSFASFALRALYQSLLFVADIALVVKTHTTWAQREEGCDEELLAKEEEGKVW